MKTVNVITALAVTVGLTGCMTTEQKAQIAFDRSVDVCARAGIYKGDKRWKDCIMYVGPEQYLKVDAEDQQRAAAGAALAGAAVGVAVGAAVASSYPSYCWRDIYGRVWC